MGLMLHRGSIGHKGMSGIRPRSPLVHSVIPTHLDATTNIGVEFSDFS